MSERIEWTRSEHSEKGKAGGFNLFAVHYALTGGGYTLTTSLPVETSLLRHKYPTPTHAKVAAERILAAFIARLTETTTDQRATGREREQG